jgi:hypothetical protein
MNKPEPKKQTVTFVRYTPKKAAKPKRRRPEKKAAE